MIIVLAAAPCFRAEAQVNLRVASQTEQYEALRARFLDRFDYDGRVAEFIAPDPEKRGEKVKFSDQAVYIGQALLVFSTEMALEKAVGGDPSDARGRLQYMLTAIDELDLKAETRFGASAALNGFFVRDDITGPQDPRLKWRFTTVESDWQVPIDAPPSGDQVFGLMYGLLGVVRFSGDEELSNHAKQISNRLYRYAADSRFILTTPDGEPTARGADLRWISSLLHDLNNTITGKNTFDDDRIDFPLNPIKLTIVSEFWDSQLVPATIEKLAGQSIHFPDEVRRILKDLNFDTDKDPALNSFALHIMLMALCSADEWTQDELESVAIKSNHHLATLMYCAYHSVRPVKFGPEDVITILSKCPPSGPSAELRLESGWSKDNRWVRCTDIFKPASSKPEGEQYNGLDWMLFRNMFLLVYPTYQSTESKPRNSRLIGPGLPQSVIRDSFLP